MIRWINALASTSWCNASGSCNASARTPVKSRCERIPTTLEPSTTGKCRIHFVAISFAASFSVVCGPTVITSVRMRSFTGTSFGPETLIDPYNDPDWSDVQTGSGQTYRGVRPSFYAEIPNLTSLFTDGTGTLYYTLFGDSNLYSRAFTADSGIVHDTRVTTGTTLPAITGAFFSGGNLYYATRADGNLSKVAFSHGSISGAPAVVSGPGVDGIDWRSKALFLGPQIAGNTPPTAVASVTCTALDCSASASGSTDPDGSIASYAWAWGDGATSTGSSATHSYATAGTYPVTLTVTDNQGATATATKSVVVTTPPPATASIAFRAAAGSNANTTSGLPSFSLGSTNVS